MPTPKNRRMKKADGVDKRGGTYPGKPVGDQNITR